MCVSRYVGALISFSSLPLLNQQQRHSSIAWLQCGGGASYDASSFALVPHACIGKKAVDGGWWMVKV